MDDLLAFFADRLKVRLREQGVRHDLIAAVFAGGAEDDIVRLLARVDALRDFLDTEDGANLLTAYRRASNIVRIEENKDGTIYDGRRRTGSFLRHNRKSNVSESAAGGADISGALEGERFGEAMAALAVLRAPVDAFFDHVTVNCREFHLRVNRLRLLSQIVRRSGGSGLLTNRRVGSKAMTKWVYTFGDGKAEGGAKDKNLLGGKGANLAEMSSLGIPVPAGFTISTEVCTYYENDRTYPPDLKDQVLAGLAHVEKVMGAKFGATEGPLLLVSVRSGARASMPGMMDTVLNLGLNDQTVLNLVKLTGDERFAYDSYRRFIQMYSGVVMDVDKEKFEHLLEQHKEEVGKHYDVELTPDDWKAVIQQFKNEVRKQAGKDFPQDPHEQLWGAVGAVFGSWMNKRAITYRKLNNLPDHWGTAVNVQAMVFGNMGEDSATGVCFSRNPSTGRIYSTASTWSTRRVKTWSPASARRSRCRWPRRRRWAWISPRWRRCCRRSITSSLPSGIGSRSTIATCRTWSSPSKGKLWMLQTRNGKHRAGGAADRRGDVRRRPDRQQGSSPPRRTGAARPAAASDDRSEGQEGSAGQGPAGLAWRRIGADRVHRRRGGNVGQGGQEGDPNPYRDVAGRHRRHARRPGHSHHARRLTSHAAVVARGMGTPCVAGAGDLRIDYAAKRLTAGNTVLNEGDMITIDGSNGQVLKGEVQDPAGADRRLRQADGVGR